ncbi:hypothetical protein [Stagnimonas aquatica]|uniref:hypothetical protein n=1 Tax=Stagnimonas aquatica TaxID=2689987 RepID=UPI00131504BC|nr:hypothetical protein [Stagnimonas aquatica]
MFHAAIDEALHTGLASVAKHESSLTTAAFLEQDVEHDCQHHMSLHKGTTDRGTA